jgi:predicted lipoprotein
MARKAVTGLDMPFDEAVADPAKRGVATYLAIVLRSVRDTFAGRVAGGLGLSAGFSSSDGD